MYKLLLSLRYFRTRFLAFAALLAVTFGVAMLLIANSIMGGFLVQLRENIRGQESHLQVTSARLFGVTHLPQLREAIEAVENVAATAPFIERLAIYFGLTPRPCHLKGIDPLRHGRVTTFHRHVLRPDELDAILAAHAPPPYVEDSGAAAARMPEATGTAHEILASASRRPLEAAEIGFLLGNEWSRKLLERTEPEILEALEGQVPPPVIVGLHWLLERQMSLGQVITITTLSPLTEAPLTLKFLVAGAFRSGDFDVDSASIYADIDRVKNDLGLFDPDAGSYRYQGLRVALHDPDRLEETQKRLEETVRRLQPFYEVKSWKDLRKTFLRAVLIEKFLVYFLILILVFFTGSMILLMLLLAVIEKTRDVGILMALGATPRGVIAIFLGSGLVICIAGTLLGLGLGVLFSSNINEIHDAIYRFTGWKLFPAEIYHMDRIPIAFQALDIALSTLPPMAIGLLASLIPALWATRRNPIKAIQYE
jgi:ABC-type lipoprotein release transport system permease subunit